MKPVSRMTGPAMSQRKGCNARAHNHTKRTDKGKMQMVSTKTEGFRGGGKVHGRCQDNAGEPQAAMVRVGSWAKPKTRSLYLVQVPGVPRPVRMNWQP